MPGGRTSHSVLPSQQEMGTCTTPPQLMSLRKIVAQQLINAAKGLEKDTSKERISAAAAAALYSLRMQAARSMARGSKAMMPNLIVEGLKYN